MIDIPVESLPLIPTMIWDGISLFSISDGLKLIDYCGRHEIDILGMEGFIVNGGRRIPDMDCIADFSSSLNEKCYTRKSLDAVIRIMDGIDDRELLLEFVLVKI
jgi:hypothetical protein